ncbi:hypothetical protein WA026_020978 [Henosepilachna vigintioctopunctata]|uniref:Choline transporter-like protein n=1 Tax=Henosepilachna vigintioctopunctata TaxID=420089 RepID=A0AAW1VGV3_9CUCU
MSLREKVSSYSIYNLELSERFVPCLGFEKQNYGIKATDNAYVFESPLQLIHIVHSEVRIKITKKQVVRAVETVTIKSSLHVNSAHRHQLSLKEQTNLTTYSARPSPLLTLSSLASFLYHHLTETAVFNGIHVRGKECVAECPHGFEPTFNTCLPKFTNKNTTDNLDDIVGLMGEIGRDMGRGWWAILLSAVVSCLLCFGTMSLFRWAVDFVVWFIIIGSIVILAILGGLCWYAYFHFKDDPLDDVGNTKDQGAGGFLILTIFFSIIIAVLIIVITSMVKRVKLIIALFREASKAIFDVPFMILIPVYTSILVTLSFLIFVVLTFFMALAGKLSEVAPNYLEYRLDGVMITALAYNIFGYIWVTQFIIGAQYIIIAGGVSAWFFTRNKHYLDSPLWTSFTNFTHFHLGTVAIGSLVIILMSTLRPLLKSVAKITKTKWISNIEEFIMFLSKKDI